MLNAMADGEDPLGALAEMGVPQPVLIELLERDYAAAEPPAVEPPEPDYEPASLDAEKDPLGQDVISRVESVTELLAEALEYIRWANPNAYPDERTVMRSVAKDLERHVIDGIRRREDAADLEVQDKVMDAPSYHYERFGGDDEAAI